jgi:glycosyltransferase involved in cell wall biosynthesis
VSVIHNTDAWRLLAQRPEPAPSSEPQGLSVHRLETRWAGLSCLITQQTGRPGVYKSRIRRILQNGRFDVINYHNISLAGGPGVLAMGDGLKLYMAHEHWLVCPSHVLWRHNRELCTGRQCLRCVLSYRRPPQLWRSTGLLARKLRHVDAVIAMSRFSRDKHQEFGLPFDMDVLPYFLEDPAPSGPDRNPSEASPHDRPYFLFAGRLERIKGLQDVIPLFKEYEAADLLVAGDGDYAVSLKALAQGIDRVRFLGRIGLEELRRYYRQAIALIVPSICYETFGIILIEAFKERTPVIARRIGPFTEIVETAQGGLLFTSRDDLLEAMRRLQTDISLRERLADSGYNAFVQHWSESAVLPQYLDIVRRAGERRAAGSLR